MTEIEHWIRIAWWISCVCSGLEKRPILQLPKFHLLGSSTVFCTTGKCHGKMALFKIIFPSRCSHFPFSWMMMAQEGTAIFPGCLWDLLCVWTEHKADKQEQYSTSLKIFPASQKVLVCFICNVQISGKLWITYFFSCKNVSCSLGWQICNSFHRAKQIK